MHRLNISLILPNKSLGFPGSSGGKEFACHAGGPILIPGLGRSSEEGIGYPLQYSWASVVAQTAKNLPIMWETGFDPWVGKILEEGIATHSSILAWRNSMDRGAWEATVYGVTKIWTPLKWPSTQHTTHNKSSKQDLKESNCFQITKMSQTKAQ